jgi:uncharacterized SAM-dependent methyltransferase
MYLQAKKNLTVQWQGKQRHFKQDETIHTENSYKWSIQKFTNLLLQSGFTNTQHWSDQKSHYALFWAS